MAKLQSHFTLTTAVAIAYAAVGVSGLHIPLDTVLLGSVIFVIGGALPNVDEGNGPSAREFGGILAAVSPLMLFSLFPSMQRHGVSQVALISVFTYVVCRVVIARGLQNYTVHRGVFHSLPAAVLTFEAIYLIFLGLPFLERFYLAFGGFAGFLTHLIHDAYGNLDLVGRAMGKGERKPRVLKLGGNTWGSTVAVYSCVFFLAWFIVRDFYPNFHFVAGVKY